MLAIYVYFTTDSCVTFRYVKDYFNPSIIAPPPLPKGKQASKQQYTSVVVNNFRPIRLFSIIYLDIKLCIITVLYFDRSKSQ